MPMQRMELFDAEPAANQVQIAVAAIGRGAGVVLPTETVYGFAALPRDIGWLQALKGRDPAHVFTLHVASSAAVGDLSPRARRLAAAFWPGPLTLVVPVSDGGVGQVSDCVGQVSDSPGQAGGSGDTVGWRVPDHPFTRAVIEAIDGGRLLMTSVNRSGSPALNTAAEIEREFGSAIELLVVDDPPAPAVASTVVRVVGDAVEVLREGAITAEAVLTAAAETILFVCSGNTCRSPLAEAIARREIAQRLGVDESALLARGYRVVSAGVGAGFGAPASEGSRTVAAEVGLDLTMHRSQPLTPSLLESAAEVYCMSDSHVAAIINYLPELADRVRLLDDAGVTDPFGAEVEVYREARERIAAAVLRRLGQRRW